MAKSNARMMYERYPKLFKAMFEHSMAEDPAHPDDNGVIYSKLMANAMGKEEPYWTPEAVDMNPIYEEFRVIAKGIMAKAEEEKK